MAKINILDKTIYNRISAGEVVDRPYSVVKELVENSIDAGATEITVNIVNGGKDIIEVFDNGCGIDKDDLPNAILPHATSKIKSIDDLDCISTLGFRGEALASIAAVSKMMIATKTEDGEIGYEISVEGGEIVDQDFTPRNKGTSITVSELFYNTPARLKFLKSTRSETSDITDIMSRLIFANPNIAIKFMVEDEIIFDSHGDGLMGAFLAIYGFDTINGCYRIRNYKDGVTIDGYISKPMYSKPNRTYQTAMVNGRYVVNGTIQSAIHNAYSSYLMKRKYPLYVLNISINKEFVDVNVTPNKSDVRFQDNSVVYGAIYSTISKILDGKDDALNIVKDIDGNTEVSFDSVKADIKEQHSKPYPNRIKDDPSIIDMIINSDDPKDKEPITVEEYLIRREEKILQKKIELGKLPESSLPSYISNDIFEENKRYIRELEEKKAKGEQIEFEQKPELRYLGQVLNTYLIIELGDDVFFVDQHAAHERLNYNGMYARFLTNSIAVQNLLVPYILKLNSEEMEFVHNRLDLMKNLGFEIKESGYNQITISSIPANLPDIDIVSFFDDMLDDCSLKRDILPETLNEKIMQKACKASVKAGKTMSQKEVDELLKLLNGDMSLRCPHGRPISVKITKREIEKWFKRIP